MNFQKPRVSRTYLCSFCSHFVTGSFKPRFNLFLNNLGNLCLHISHTCWYAPTCQSLLTQLRLTREVSDDCKVGSAINWNGYKPVVPFTSFRQRNTGSHLKPFKPYKPFHVPFSVYSLDIYDRTACDSRSQPQQLIISTDSCNSLSLSTKCLVSRMHRGNMPRLHPTRLLTSQRHSSKG